MNDFDLLENARDTTWEHDLVSATEIRARGSRRTRVRRVSVAATAFASVAIVYALAGPINAPSPEQVATDPSTNVVNLNGAQLDLPPDWQVLNRPSAGHVCVGDATQPPDSCPVRVAVADDPATALVSGLDVVPDLMTTCEPDDPQFVEVTHDAPGTTTYSGRCTGDSPVMTAWSFDNRTLYVLAAELRWRADGADIFNSVSVPSHWPQAPAPAVTESATPSSSTVTN